MTPTTAAAATNTTRGGSHGFVRGVHGVRYQVKDVVRSVAFYTTHLSFTLEHQHLPEIAGVSFGDTRLLLSGPEASGSRPMPNGQRQEPGGWNRVVLHVTDLPGCIAAMKKAGLHFRNEMETGPAGRQIQVEDPDGNPIELFEPAQSEQVQLEQVRREKDPDRDRTKNTNASGNQLAGRNVVESHYWGSP
jgi:glyoxylase I family protein